jgi:hypothetical protein
MKMKNYFSATLALCLALTLSIAPCAAADDAEEQTAPETEQATPLTEDQLDAAEDQIDVTVPAVGNLLLNPYKLKSSPQIGHTPQALVNHCDFPVAVNVEIAGRVSAGSEAVLMDAPPAEDCTEKEVFLYIEFSTDADNWADSYTGAANQLVATKSGTRGENVMTLDGYGEGYFHFSGAMATNAQWAKTDTFGATVIFSFEPAVTEEVAPVAGGAFGGAAPAEAPAQPAETVEPEISAEQPAEAETPADLNAVETAENQEEVAPAEDAQTEPETSAEQEETPSETTETPSEEVTDAEQTTEATDAEQTTEATDAEQVAETDSSTDETPVETETKQEEAAPAEDAQTEPETEPEGDAQTAAPADGETSAPVDGEAATTEDGAANEDGTSEKSTQDAAPAESAQTDPAPASEGDNKPDEAVAKN